MLCDSHIIQGKLEKKKKSIQHKFSAGAKGGREISFMVSSTTVILILRGSQQTWLLGRKRKYYFVPIVIKNEKS